MKKNNKGVTLIELIVSFAIVGVAIIYFFQTLTTVNKLYETAREDTNEFVEKSYVLRLANAYADDFVNKNCSSNCKISGNTIPGTNYTITSIKKQQNNVYKITIENTFNLYKYIILENTVEIS